METFDVVIVGAGSAGCVLANRLSAEQDRRVLLLEAGRSDRQAAIRVPAAFPTLFDGTNDWAFRTEPQPELDGRRLFWPRGRVLGGSSSLNAMMWIRGFPSDFDRWGRLVDERWSHARLAPYFERAEAVATAVPGPFGRDGPLPVNEQRDPNPLTSAFLAAAAQRGIAGNERRNDGPEEGVALSLVNQHRGARVNAARAYLGETAHRRNLVVRTTTFVEQLLVANGAVHGVRYRRDRKIAQVHCGTVIVSAGAVGSPALLLASGIGPAEELVALGVRCRVDAPEVGKNLQDHLAAGIAVRARRPVTLAGARRLGPLLRYLVARRGLLTSNVAEAYGYVRSDPTLEECDLELLFLPAPFVNEGLTPPAEHGFTLAAVLLQPESRGEIRLASADPAAAPLIDPRYCSDPAGSDRARLEEGVRRCVELAGASALASESAGMIVPEGELDDSLAPEALRRYAQTLYHPVGTCRMGRDENSVVDPALALRGLTGCYVVDASVIPTIPHGHTHAPVVAIAECAAELLGA